MSNPSTPATVPTLGSGLPVAVGQIDREIKKLWEQSGNVASRASLINLAVYCEGEEAMARNTALIGRIAMNHACRAILIVAEPNAPENDVQAWISAHCHTSRAGAKQTCCEQITFLLKGPSRNLIPNIVFSHLDSDLPLFLWWQGEFADPVDSQLWTWVDRLIYDSNDWRDQCAQLRLLRESISKSSRRIILCDLNWTRTLYLRQALSTTFDHPDYLPHLSQVTTVEITHAPGFRSTAQLFAGWIASRLKLKESSARENGAEFTTPNGENLSVVWKEKAGAAVSSCTLIGPDATFEFYRTEESEFLHADVTCDEGRHSGTLFPAGKEEPDALVNEELARGGRHRVYLEALSVAERLF